MNKTVITLISIVVLAVSPRFARAQLRISDPTVDVGEVRAGNLLKHTFSLANGSSGVAEIIEARASCGCLASHVSKRSLQPGETVEVILEVNTLSQPAGRNTWTVKIVSREGGKDTEVCLRLLAKLIREVEVGPTAVTFIAGSEMTHELTVTDRRERPLVITDVQCSSPKIAAALADRPPDKRVSKILIRLAGDCPEGRHEEAVAIFTNDSDYPQFKVPITVVKQGRQRITANPNHVTLTVSPGQAVPTRVLRVRAPDNQTVIIERITTDHSAIAATWAPGPGSMATVKTSIDRLRITTNELQSTIHVHISKPFQETLSIPVSCTLQ